MYIMQVRISRWGNSLGLRIPKAAVDATGLREGDLVEVVQENGGLRIEPVDDIDIAGMIAAITPENLHRDEGWIDAPAAGREW
jgi:antitoxin MazE